MSHPDDQRLVLYLLGDEDDRKPIDAHVQACEECGAEITRLQGMLARLREAPVPEPDAAFEERVWERQQRALGEASAGPDRQARAAERPASAGRWSAPRFWGLRRVMLAGAVAASLAVAFLAGLYAPRTGDAPATAAAPGTAPDRLLLVAMGDHLERTRMVLVELSNVSDLETFHTQQVQARSLISDNRLYRQTARLGGQPAVADVLDEVERVLLEVARSADETPADELAWLRQRIADRGLLFKVTVIEGSARQDAEPPRLHRPSI